MARTGCRFASEDEYLDAVHDAAYERFIQEAVTCAECGTLYDQGYHPSTRFEPAWVLTDTVVGDGGDAGGGDRGWGTK
jgi:hypothetical protein